MYIANFEVVLSSIDEGDVAMADLIANQIQLILADCLFVKKATLGQVIEIGIEDGSEEIPPALFMNEDIT